MKYQLLLKDLLKFSKKAAVDTTELEVRTTIWVWFDGLPPLITWTSIMISFLLESYTCYKAVIMFSFPLKWCFLSSLFLPESGGGHVCCSQKMQRHDERWASPRLRRKTHGLCLLQGIENVVFQFGHKFSKIAYLNLISAVKSHGSYDKWEKGLGLLSLSLFSLIVLYDNSMHIICIFHLSG